MSKMFKRMVCMVLSGVMVCSLAACGNSAKSSSTTQAGDVVTWPKNIEIIAPAGAGGDTDFNARLLSQKLGERLPSNFVVSNVTGNSGATGTRQVKDAKNDGSSVLFYHTAFLVNEASGTTDYGLDEYSFASIAAKNPGNVLVVRADLGITTLEELQAYTKANPGKLKMAANTGATSYAIALQMKQAGFDMNVVDAGGGADRLLAVLGGHVDVILAAYGVIKDYVEEGALIPLAMDGEEDFTDETLGVSISAFHNLGYEEIKLPFYYFFAFPKGTDEALIQQFNDTLKDIIENDADYQKKIYDAYLQPPFYLDFTDGLKQFDEVKDLLNKIDLK